MNSIERVGLSTASLVALALLASPAAQQDAAVPQGGSVSSGLASEVMPISLAPRCTHTVTSIKLEPDVFPVSWTHNIRLDNLVLARYTARGPRR